MRSESREVSEHEGRPTKAELSFVVGRVNAVVIQLNAFFTICSLVDQMKLLANLEFSLEDQVLDRFVSLSITVHDCFLDADSITDPDLAALLIVNNVCYQADKMTGKLHLSVVDAIVE